MEKDILGNKELEAINLDWSVSTPGLMSTRCCASGTCEDRPLTGVKNKNIQIIFQLDSKNVFEIRSQYGDIRSYL